MSATPTIAISASTIGIFGEAEAVGDLLRHVGARDQDHHGDEEEELQVQEQADDDRDPEHRDQGVGAHAERLLHELLRQVGKHRGEGDQGRQDQLSDAQAAEEIKPFLLRAIPDPPFLCPDFRPGPPLAIG